MLYLQRGLGLLEVLISLFLISYITCWLVSQQSQLNQVTYHIQSHLQQQYMEDNLYETHAGLNLD